MKKSTSLKILLIILVLWSIRANAQDDAATYFAKFITAQKSLKGDGLTKDTVRAFRLFKHCAENGKMPDAMLHLGVMYKKGYGTTKDLQKAFDWFSKCADKENPGGMCQLGLMYKNGEGVPQNFPKAYEYFKASADRGFPGGIYGAGYCRYKGLGVKQSYTEAVKWFKLGVDNNPSCAFMLGLCYRNGFGVEQNEQEANRLLRNAIEKKLMVAQKELNKKISEKNEAKIARDKRASKSKGEKENAQVEKFKRTKHNTHISLNGDWVGTRSFYDWSGQHVLYQEDVLINLTQKGSNIFGQWVENDKVIVEFKGMVVDDQIVFNGSGFNGKNRYDEIVPMEFRSARFEMVNADVDYLTGNIETFSPQTKEPGRPCYIVMSRLKIKKATIDSTATIDTDTTKVENVQEILANEQVEVVSEPEEEQNGIGTMQNEALDFFKEKDTFLTVYPNPFDNWINISYQIDNERKIGLYIYNSVGSLVIQKDLGVKQKGSHLEKVFIDGLPGQYIVRVVAGNEVYAKIIIKQ